MVHDLNLRRIVTYAVGLYVVTLAASVLVGKVGASKYATTTEALDALRPTAATLGAVITVAVFGALGYVQRSKLVRHAVLVASVSWLLSFPLNVLVYGQSIDAWMHGAAGHFAFGALGVGCGVLLRKLKTGHLVGTDA